MPLSFRSLFVAILLFIHIFVSLLAQHPVLPAEEAIKKSVAAGFIFPRLALFSASQKHVKICDSLQSSGLVPQGAHALVVDQNNLKDILRLQGHHLALELSYSEKKMTLILEEQILFTNTSKILTPLDIKGEAPAGGRHFRGIVHELPGSLASVSVFENEVMAVISTPNDGNINIALSEIKNTTEHNVPIHILIYEKKLPAISDFLCGVEDSLPGMNQMEEAEQVSSLFDTRCRTVRIFLECDYKMYQDRNLQKSQVVNYVTGLFNVVKTLYANERVNLEISDIMVWTTPDPFPKTTLNEILFSYANYRRNTFNGDLAQLVSTANTQQKGGIAFVNVICNTYNGSSGPVSYARIDNNFQNLPVYSWSVMVMAHELGHNFGSWHTHSCVWGPNKDSQLDNCQPPDLGSCPPGPAPTSGGTVMSYCHLTGYGINLALGFGKEPGDVLRNSVNTKTCLTPSLVPNISPNAQGPYFEGDVLRLKATPVKTSYTFDWFHYDYRLPGKNDSFIDLKYSGIYRAAISDNCTEYSSPDTIQIHEFKANLGCPVKKGKLDSVYSEMVISVDNTERTDTLIFPSGVFSTIPAQALDVLVELQTNISPKGTSWARSVVLSFSSPTTLDIAQTNYRPAILVPSMPPVPKDFSRILGRFDPAGSWIFRSLDDRTDLGIDAEVTLRLTLKWRMPDTVESCIIPVCKGSSRRLEANIPGATYKWSHGPQTRSVDIASAGTYTVTITKGNKSSSHSITLQDYETFFENQVVICQGEAYQVGNRTYTLEGDYIDSLIASNGCDSIIATRLIVLPITESQEEISLCYGDSLHGIAFFNDTTLMIRSTGFNGCDSSHARIVRVNPEIRTQAIVVPDCENLGARVELISEGGSGNIEYTWFDGSKDSLLTGIKSGVYSYYAKDQMGCMINKLFEVKNFDSVAVDARIENLRCFGDSSGMIDLELISGTEPVEYLWSNQQSTQDLSGIPSGTYTVYLRDQNNCRTELSYTIQSPDLLLASVQATPSNGSNGQAKVSGTGGTKPYSYQWSNGENGDEIHMLEPGDYSVTVTDANECIRVVSFHVKNSVSIYGPSAELSATANPNPFTDKIILHYTDPELVVEMWDIMGVKMCTPSFIDQDQTCLQTNHIPPGIYRIRLSKTSGVARTISVIKIE